jgi:hypothetical protein
LDWFLCRKSKVHRRSCRGEQVAVTQPAAPFQNRGHPVLHAYRAVLCGSLTRMYGMSPAQPDHVFVGVAPKDLALI